MKRSRRKLFSLLFLLILAALVGVPGWLTYRDIHQQQLDRALIAAIKKQDTPKVIALLNAGANANTCDIPRDTRPFWRQMWDQVRGKKPVFIASAPTALWVHLHLLTAKWLSLSETVSTSEVQQQMAQAENVPLLDALIHHDANITMQDSEGASPLFAALDCGYCVSAHRLWSSQVDLRHQDSAGMNLLMQAVWANCPDIVAKLLDRGASVNTQDISGQTALFYVKTSSIARILLDKGIDLQIKDNSGDTILLNNIREGGIMGKTYDVEDEEEQEKIIALLIQHSANLNAVDSMGMTALILACQKDDARSAQFLIQHGANVRIKDKRGKTALYYAQQNDLTSLIPLLKKAAARK